MNLFYFWLCALTDHEKQCLNSQNKLHGNYPKQMCVHTTNIGFLWTYSKTNFNWLKQTRIVSIFTTSCRSHRGKLYSVTLTWHQLPYKLPSNTSVLNYAALASKYLKSMILENNLLLSMLMHQNNNTQKESISFGMIQK